MTFRIVPIAPHELDAARASAIRVVADEEHAFPCRICLRDAAVGETMLLLSYASFPAGSTSPYRTMSPVYAHATPCRPYEPQDGVPDLLRRRLLSVRAYDDADFLKQADVTPGTELEALVDRLFATSAVRRLHVHLARPGCFACRIERP